MTFIVNFYKTISYLLFPYHVFVKIWLPIGHFQVINELRGLLMSQLRIPCNLVQCWDQFLQTFFQSGFSAEGVNQFGLDAFALVVTYTTILDSNEFQFFISYERTKEKKIQFQNLLPGWKFLQNFCKIFVIRPMEWIDKLLYWKP